MGVKACVSFMINKIIDFIVGRVRIVLIVLEIICGCGTVELILRAAVIVIVDRIASEAP